MAYTYAEYWHMCAGKETVEKADEIMGIMRGEPPFGSGPGPEVIDLGDDGRQLPRETEGTDDGT